MGFFFGLIKTRSQLNFLNLPHYYSAYLELYGIMRSSYYMIMLSLFNISIMIIPHRYLLRIWRQYL